MKIKDKDKDKDKDQIRSDQIRLDQIRVEQSRFGWIDRQIDRQTGRWQKGKKDRTIEQQ